MVDETCWCCILSLEAAASDITVIPDQLILLSSISYKNKQRILGWMFEKKVIVANYVISWYRLVSL